MSQDRDRKDPVVVAGGHYTAPTVPGFSSEMHPASIAAYRYPDGAFWAADFAEEEKRTNQ